MEKGNLEGVGCEVMQELYQFNLYPRSYFERRVEEVRKMLEKGEISPNHPLVRWLFGGIPPKNLIGD